MSLLSINPKELPLDLQQARTAIVGISVVVTCVVHLISINLFVQYKTNFNIFVASTYYFGILAAVAKLFYELDPYNQEKATNIGEVALAVAMSLHETLVVYRFTILSANKFKISRLSRPIWASIWIACLYRIIAEFLPKEGGFIVAKIIASYLFYAYIVIMDIVLSMISFKLIYEIKKNLLMGTPDTRALALVRSVQRLIGSEIVIALTALFLNLPLSDDPKEPINALVKPLTDFCIYLAGYCALVYAASLMKLITLRPHLKNDPSMLSPQAQAAIKDSIKASSRMALEDAAVKDSQKVLPVQSELGTTKIL
ncbi:hypothetical protein MP228_003815 [Amoeboaphelidium protococcarum]|nr:hypothetical protein MP228_003815 [Amoeboaphelidium protococcarum]